MREKITKNIGKINEHTRTKITFNLGYESINEIYSMTPSCGCSQPKIKEDKIVVTFNSQSVPNHLRGQGFYNKTANIKVRYNDGEEQMLHITATVVI